MNDNVNINNGTEFSTISPVYYWTQRVLPLVYEDSLTKTEIMGKIIYTLNQLIKDVNLIPELIAEMIKEYITSGALEKVITEILLNTMINVKYPPNDLPPAKGDGTTDDTATFQGCLDYAQSIGGGMVYVPYGRYSVGSLNMHNRVSLVGGDKYTSIMVCRGGSSNPFIGGSVQEVTIRNLTFDGNGGFQVNPVDAISMSCSNCHFENLILQNSNTNMLIEKVSGTIELNEIIFKQGNDTHLVIGGTAGNIVATRLFFENLSNANGVACLITDANGDFYTDININSNAPVGVQCDGDNNQFTGKINGVKNPVENNGNNNTFELFGLTVLENYTGNVTTNANLIDLNAKDIILNPVNPLTYKTPDNITDIFSTVDFKDNNSSYKVLVANKTELPFLYGLNSQDSDMALVFASNNDSTYWHTQGGVYINNSYMMANTDSTNTNVQLTEFNLATKTITRTAVINNGGHGSSLAYNATDNIIYLSTFMTGASEEYTKTLILLNYQDLSVIKTLTFTFNSVSVTYDNQTNKLYITDDNYNLYELVNEQPVLKLNFASLIKTTFEDVSIQNGLMALLLSDSNIIYIVDINKNMVIKVFSNIEKNSVKRTLNSQNISWNGFDLYVGTYGYIINNSTQTIFQCMLNKINLSTNEVNLKPKPFYTPLTDTTVFPCYVDYTTKALYRDGTQDNPFVSVDEALSSFGMLSYGALNINLIGEVNDLYIHSFNKNISITGGTINKVTLEECNGTIFFNNVAFGTFNSQVVYSTGIGQVYFNNCSFNITGSGIQILKTNAYFLSCTFTYTNYCFNIGTMGRVLCDTKANLSVRNEGGEFYTPSALSHGVDYYNQFHITGRKLNANITAGGSYTMEVDLSSYYRGFFGVNYAGEYFEVPFYIEPASFTTYTDVSCVPADIKYTANIKWQILNDSKQLNFVSASYVEQNVTTHEYQTPTQTATITDIILFPN